jgi:trans-aconitate 2-methyltransferase
VDWDAHAYTRLARPQLRWGLEVLERVDLDGVAVALDAGCGNGQLTEELLRRLSPGAHVIACDRSPSMLAEARRRLDGVGERVRFLECDLLELALREEVDLIFSTATFHWIPDHGRLFEVLHRSLVPGGRLVAQCGGAGNLDRLLARARALLARGGAEYREPAYFATPQETAERLRRAGFGDVETGLQQAPTPFPDAATYRAFIATAVFLGQLPALGEPQGSCLLDELAEQAADDDPPFTLDYVRLNLRGRRAGPA